MTEAEVKWDREVDVLVIGSGAGGLLGATVAASEGLRVLVAEKSDQYGGTSATSGGGIWIPNSPLAPADQHRDSPEEAFAYIRALAADFVPDEKIRAYVRHAPEMLRWVGDHTPVRYVSLPYIDYHAEVPGGKLGFRTHLPLPMDGAALGDDFLDMRPTSPAASLFGRINWDIAETFALLFRPKGWMKTAGRMIGRYVFDLPHRFRSPKDRHLTLGTALIGGLRLAAKEKGVDLVLRAPLERLLVEEGRVVGAELRRGGRPWRVRAAKGVILAAGGFERDPDMRRRFLPQVADPLLSGSQDNNTGDAIRAGREIGATTPHLGLAWWAPVFSVPGEDRSRLSTIERALPGSLIVGSDGRRYLNEASSYHVVGRQMAEADRADRRTNPSWLIFDATYRKAYPIGPVLPLTPDFLLSKRLRALLKRGRTVEALAEAIGVPAAALAETIRTFNEGARKGEDPAFGRGGNAYDKMFGDMRVGPNPSLRAIETGPFYAMPIHPGDIGTCSGLETDGEARVLDAAGAPIPGLWAVGNTTTSVMGGSYPGAGSTLGPAMTFAWVAARRIAGRTD